MKQATKALIKEWFYSLSGCVIDFHRGECLAQANALIEFLELQEEKGE